MFDNFTNTKSNKNIKNSIEKIQVQKTIKMKSGFREFKFQSLTTIELSKSRLELDLATPYLLKSLLEIVSKLASVLNKEL